MALTTAVNIKFNIHSNGCSMPKAVGAVVFYPFWTAAAGAALI